MRDKIKEDFLRDVLIEAGHMYDKSLLQIEDNFTQELPSIAESLLVSLTCGLDKYQELEIMRKAGTLNFIYVSYLRTSVVADNFNYRLDFYDNQNRYSLVECSMGWNFDYIFSHLNDLRSWLKTKFEDQTRVPEYEMDKILFDMSHRYRKISDKKIDLLLRYLIGNRGKSLFAEKTVEFYRGDFLDKVTHIFRCEDGEIVDLEG